MEWIKVIEELPSSKKPVHFTFCDDGEIHKDIWYDYYEKDWMKEGPMSSYGAFRGKVTHWMPFPEKPIDQSVTPPSGTVTHEPRIFMEEDAKI